jgi:uncharacterized membrane protein YvbJ
MPLNPILCQKCNSVNRPEANFCHECGNSLAESPPARENKSKPIEYSKGKYRLSTRQSTIIIILIVLLFITLIVAGGMFIYWLTSGGSLSGLF